jgi:NAD(P)-dependent dehydrogenase (short-subunit alcohol dehydrogenase family)
MGRLTGKDVLITGGTTGIGFASAKLLLREGARVAITGQDEERVVAAGKELGPDALAIRADVRSARDMSDVASRLREAFGGLDVVFANAGIAPPAPLAELDEAHIDEVLGVNIKGVLFTVQKTLPLLRNPASVILNGSTLIDQGIPGLSVYSASKAAVRSLARTLSAELIERGIRVNTLSPGLIDTPIYQKVGLPPHHVQAWTSQLAKKIPYGRFGTPDEVARAVLFLASDDSSYFVGGNLLYDGGMATI